jgi:hypothetical protein
VQLLMLEVAYRFNCRGILNLTIFFSLNDQITKDWPT